MQAGDAEQANKADWFEGPTQEEEAAAFMASNYFSSLDSGTQKEDPAPFVASDVFQVSILSTSVSAVKFLDKF
jgi:hypothetical protein